GRKWRDDFGFVWSRGVLTGSPCQNFPRPWPEEGPESSAELLLVAIHLSRRQIDSIDIIKLFRISKQFSSRRLQIIWSDDAQLDLDQLPDLAIHRPELRRLAPAAIEQRICSHNTRCRGRLWVSHNADKRIYRCLGVTARQRSYFGWCNGHLSAFSSLARSPSQQ